MADHADLRAGLVHRQLPEMQLADGGSSALSSPPPPFPRALDAAGRAEFRFSIVGSAVITGGTGNLALEVARAYLEHGLSNLALFDIDTSEASSLVQSLRDEFPSARIVTRDVDVTNAEVVNRAVGETAREFGSIDILCCFAGVVGCAHAADMTFKEWKRVMDVNASGVFTCAQAVGKQMIAQGTGGSMIFIASISAHSVNFPQPQVHYNASKAAVLHLSRSLAAEWARYGIRCNTVSPGYMNTILNEGPGLDRARNIWKARTPLGRMGEPQELCGPLVMLASRAGSYITGADLLIDGGLSVF